MYSRSPAGRRHGTADRHRAPCGKPDRGLMRPSWPHRGGSFRQLRARPALDVIQAGTIGRDVVEHVLYKLPVDVIFGRLVQPTRHAEYVGDKPMTSHVEIIGDNDVSPRRAILCHMLTGCDGFYRRFSVDI